MEPNHEAQDVDAPRDGEFLMRGFQINPRVVDWVLDSSMSPCAAGLTAAATSACVGCAKSLRFLIGGDYGTPKDSTLWTEPETPI